jgi:hypothetical protein
LAIHSGAPVRLAFAVRYFAPMRAPLAQIGVVAVARARQLEVMRDAAGMAAIGNLRVRAPLTAGTVASLRVKIIAAQGHDSANLT